MCQYLIKCVGHGGGEFDEVFLFEIFFVWVNKDKGERLKAKGQKRRSREVVKLRWKGSGAVVN